MGDKVRGSVTPLSESISVQDAENAAKKVAEAIEAQMRELRTLQGFSDENRSLQKLLLELPDLISYNIMVPFGKAAFMPGRLIHTNEFMVLLGEGYYAERSAKQAAEIMKRHSEIITTKMDALKEQIKDLEVEATFAKETATEAAGGLVEIREEYVEPPLQPTTSNNTATSTTRDANETDSDSEHSRIMARLAELEMAEKEDDEDDDEEEEDEEEETETNLRAALRRSLLADSDDDDEEEDEDEEEEDDEDELDLDDRTAANTLLNTGYLSEDDEEEDGTEEFQSSIITKPTAGPTFQSSVITKPTAGPSFQSSIITKPAAGPSGQRHVQFSANSPTPEPLPSRDVKASAAQQRAFTGSVVERNTDLLSSVAAPAAPEAPPSRPVSKFKQRKS